MSQFSRRSFLPLSAIAAGSFLDPSQAAAQKRSAPGPVRQSEKDFYKFLAMGGDNGDIRYWIGDVIRSGDERAVERLRQSLAENKAKLNKDILISGLIQCIDERGVIGPADYMAQPYPDEKIQYLATKVLLEAGADATYHESYKPQAHPGVIFFGGLVDNLNLIHEAASSGRSSLIPLLVEHGADPKAVAVYYTFQPKMKDGKPVVDRHGYPEGDQSVPTIPYAFESTIDAAVHGKSAEAVTYLGSKGAKPAEKADPPALIYAALRGEVEIVRALLDMGVACDVRDKRGHSAEDYLRSDGPPFPQLYGPKGISRSPDALRSEYWYQGYDAKLRQSRYKFNSIEKFKTSKEVAEILHLVGTPGRAPAPPLATPPTEAEEAIARLRESKDPYIKYWTGMLGRPETRGNALKHLAVRAFWGEGDPQGGVALFGEAAKLGNRQAIRDLNWLDRYRESLEMKGYEFW
ncbi:MAG: ankyrin repeat domain-containing protein [Alphaproteobacteria bacterium]|nr:ankyrin repeat domain-containing protein [Alphaproteobacteria bacterium]